MKPNRYMALDQIYANADLSKTEMEVAHIELDTKPADIKFNNPDKLKGNGTGKLQTKTLEPCNVFEMEKGAYYTIDKALEDWSGNIDYKITDIKFKGMEQITKSL